MRSPPRITEPLVPDCPLGLELLPPAKDWLELNLWIYREGEADPLFSGLPAGRVDCQGAEEKALGLMGLVSADALRLRDG